MIDVYIWIGVWVVILIMLIISLMEIESRIAEDIINKFFEDLKKQKRGRRTMARYVDIDEVKQAWAEQAPMTYQLIKDDLDKFLTADVRENIHGMWIVDEDGNIECSVCGHHGVGDLYCERCGAQMDEGREE